jgi:hypothetical protein
MSGRIDHARAGSKARLILRLPAIAFLALALFSGSDTGHAQTGRFQEKKALTCTGNPANCRAVFNVVAANRRLDLEFVSCFLQRPSVLDDPNKAAFLGINNALTGVRHTLVWEERQAGSLRLTIVSQPVQLTVRTNERPDIAIPFTGLVPGATGDCTISGKIVVLP